MSADIKYMSIKDFREEGFLQEVNRQFFHPLGLALEIKFDDNMANPTLGGIWDYREDPEGMFFADGVISDEKILNIKKLLESKIESRKKVLNSISYIQEI